MADIVTAIVDILKADPAVAGLVAEHVYGGELPAALTPSMPRRALVVQPSGGSAFRPSSKVALEAQRIDLLAYAATPFDAAQLRAHGNLALIAVQRVASAGVLVHWVQSAGGYLAGRDRDGQWPFAFQSFQTLFATDEVP